MFTTGKGHINSGPPGMVTSNVVGYITGIPVPMILQWHHDREGYIVISPSYVQGLMDGKGVNETQMEFLRLV